jgi:hypothetical protein
MTLARTLAALGLGAVLACAACAAIPHEDVADNLQPDETQFANTVSPFMEVRCAALDCHGQEGRGMRLYSQNGLRLGEGDGGSRDTSPTTDAEHLANYVSVVGLQPEEMSRAVASHGAYQSILLLQKPLDIAGGGVRHKGGPVLAPNDDGIACLTSWISGQVDVVSCQAGAQQ